MIGKWRQYDQSRTRRRLSITVDTDVLSALERQADRRGLSLSYCLEKLILEEEQRLEKKEHVPPCA